MTKCRVGMSTNPHDRIQYWAREEGYTNYSILGEGLTYEEAQKLETQAKATYNCEGSPGGPPLPGNVWSVYLVYS